MKSTRLPVCILASALTLALPGPAHGDSDCESSARSVAIMPLQRGHILLHEVTRDPKLGPFQSIARAVYFDVYHVRFANYAIAAYVTVVKFDLRNEDASAPAAGRVKIVGAQDPFFKKHRAEIGAMFTQETSFDPRRERAFLILNRANGGSDYPWFLHTVTGQPAMMNWLFEILSPGGL